jgi:hypothetical protein
MKGRAQMALRRIFVCMIVFGLIGPAASSQERSSTESSALNNDGRVVRLWNQIATDAIVVTGANAPASSGVLMAIVQLGIYDAVVSIVGGYEPYAASIDAPASASIDAAVAQSAHDVLVDLLPAQAAALDAQLAGTLATIPDGQAKSDGIWVGQLAAAGILANRAGDGRFADLPYTFGVPGPGIYQPTPPAFSTSPLVPWVAHVRPFTVTSPSQFRPGPPPSLSSRKWSNAYNLTRAFGDINSTIRTGEQSEIAIFWTEHTVRQWNRNIRLQAAREALDDVETARLLAITNTAMADAWIGCWDAKYHYSFWRPVTAIQQGDTDGRSDTIGDPTWTPFRITPNHPEYPGAHSCVSTAASHALKRFFRSDRTILPMDAVIGGVTYIHTFTRYTDAGAEAMAARIFGGMHYTFSNEAGARLARHIVRQMFANGCFRRVQPFDVPNRRATGDTRGGCRAGLNDDDDRRD